MNEGTDEDEFDLTQVKRVQVVGLDEINDKLLNGWLLLRILTRRLDGADEPRFVIGRKAAETPKV